MVFIRATRSSLVPGEGPGLVGLGPARSGSVRPGQARSGPVRLGLARSGPVRLGPARSGLVQLVFIFNRSYKFGTTEKYKIKTNDNNNKRKNTSKKNENLKKVFRCKRDFIGDMNKPLPDSNSG